MIRLANIAVRFGEHYLFRDLSWNIGLGERLALVGPNGAGKSTLFKIAAGLLEPCSGRVIKSRCIRVGYLPQEEVVLSGRTVLEEAMSVFSDLIKLRDEVDDLSQTLSALSPDDPQGPAILERIGELATLLEQDDGYRLESRAQGVLQGLGFGDADFKRRVEEFSGGWQMRLALAKLLLAEPSCLLLDEPTNHLDIEAMDFLEGFLKNYRGSLVVISHDRYFVDRMVHQVYELEAGRFSVYHTNYTGYLEQKEKRKEQLLKLREEQDRRIEHVREFISRWQGNYIKRAMVTSRERMLERLMAERVEIPSDPKEVKLRLPGPPHCGKRLVELKGISKSYGQQPVFSELDLLVLRGEKLALVGPNGAGKSTLMRILAGRDQDFIGERREFPGASIAYFAQQTAEMLDPKLTVLETVATAAPEMTAGQIRTILGAFLFPGDAVYKKVSVLSGGEKARLALCRMLLIPANLLILDEPTNHLDLSSRIVLERALKEFAGAVVLVAHDRYLLDRVAEKIVEISRGGIAIFPGNYSDYIWKKQKRNEEPPIVAAKPTGRPKEDWRRAKRIKAEAETAQRKRERTIQELEERIARLEQRQRELESSQGGLADPEVYSRGERMKALMNEYQTNREELARLYQRWECYQNND